MEHIPPRPLGKITPPPPPSLALTVDGVIGSIRWYAYENKLEPEQIKAIFEAGIAARCVILRHNA